MYDTKLLIDTIATSDEFWEFERNSELLSDKFQAYTSTLSAEEYNKLTENLNDDDYMEEFIGKANLEKELQQMNEAKENLLLHTGFSKLSEDERMLLFMQYAESREFTGKTLMITGGTGSFGNAVLNRFLKTDIGEIRIFSRDEKKQDDMRHEFQAKMPEVADKIKFIYYLKTCKRLASNLKNINIRMVKDHNDDPP